MPGTKIGYVIKCPQGDSRDSDCAHCGYRMSQHGVAVIYEHGTFVDKTAVAVEALAKRCSNCLQIKFVVEPATGAVNFHARGSDGLQNYCLDCSRKIHCTTAKGGRYRPGQKDANIKWYQILQAEMKETGLSRVQVLNKRREIRLAKLAENNGLTDSQQRRIETMNDINRFREAAGLKPLRTPSFA